MNWSAKPECLRKRDQRKSRLLRRRRSPLPPPVAQGLYACVSTLPADLLPHGQSDEMRELRDKDRRQEEELAAAWRAAAVNATTLAAQLLADPADGEESVAAWLSRRFRELGIK